MPPTACTPRERAAAIASYAASFASPYGLRGRFGLPSSCGVVAASPKISALLATKIRPGAMAEVPLDDPCQRRLEIPHRRPGEALAGLGRVQREEAGLVRVRARVDVPAKLAGPQLGDPVGDPAHGLGVLGRGPEVPA